MMVFPPELYWRVLGLVPWWCWLLGGLILLVVAGVAGLLRAAAARRRPESEPVVIEVQPEVGSADRAVRS